MTLQGLRTATRPVLAGAIPCHVFRIVYSGTLKL